MIATQMSVYTTGFCNDQTSGGGIAARVPERLAHGLRHRRDRVPLGEGLEDGRAGSGSSTNVLAMNVSGKMNMNEALFTTSTLDTFRPTYAMIQENA